MKSWTSVATSKPRRAALAAIQAAAGWVSNPLRNAFALAANTFGVSCAPPMLFQAAFLVSGRV
jgi:hypothetical protein